MSVRRKIVQVLLNDDEYQYINAMAARMEAHPGRQGRALLLAWAAQVDAQPGMIFGGQCGASGGCQVRGADWWNHASKLYFCADCAQHLNQRVPGLCLQGPAPDVDVLTEEAAKELRDKAATSRGRGRPVADPAARFAAVVREALAAFEAEEGGIVGTMDLPDSWLRELRLEEEKSR